MKVRIVGNWNHFLFSKLALHFFFSCFASVRSLCSLHFWQWRDQRTRLKRPCQSFRYERNEFTDTQFLFVIITHRHFTKDWRGLMSTFLNLAKTRSKEPLTMSLVSFVSSRKPWPRPRVQWAEFRQPNRWKSPEILGTERETIIHILHFRNLLSTGPTLIWIFNHWKAACMTKISPQSSEKKNHTVEGRFKKNPRAKRKRFSVLGRFF